MNSGVKSVRTLLHCREINHKSYWCGHIKGFFTFADTLITFAIGETRNFAIGSNLFAALSLTLLPQKGQNCI